MPLPPGDSWPNGKMQVRRTRADPTRRKNDGVGPETFANAETHWWDSSQIYGDSRAALMQYRSCTEGKLKIDTADEIIRATLLTENGAVVNPALAAPAVAEAAAAAS